MGLQGPQMRLREPGLPGRGGSIDRLETQAGATPGTHELCLANLSAAPGAKGRPLAVLSVAWALRIGSAPHRGLPLDIEAEVLGTEVQSADQGKGELILEGKTSKCCVRP